ncbi:MAG: hypothetical protein WC299_14870 [Kiritimatiellia bacterium]
MADNLPVPVLQLNQGGLQEKLERVAVKKGWTNEAEWGNMYVNKYILEEL